MNKELEHLRLLRRLVETRIEDLENNRTGGYFHEHRWYDIKFSYEMLEEFRKQGIVINSKSQQARIKYNVNYLDCRLIAEISLTISNTT